MLNVIVTAQGFRCPEHGDLSAAQVSGGQYSQYPVVMTEEFATSELICPRCAARVTIEDPSRFTITPENQSPVWSAAVLHATTGMEVPSGTS